MAVLANSFDGGTPGVALTVANSGGASGNAFTEVDPSSSPILYTSDSAHGACAVALSATDDDPYFAWQSGVTGTTTWGRAYLKMAAAPPSNTNILRHLAGTQTVITVRVGTTGRLGLLYGTGTFAANGTVTIPNGQWVRIEWTVTTGVGTGSVTAWLFTDPESATPADTLSATNVNTATAAAVTRQRMGMLSSSTWSFLLDEVAFSSDGPLGPVESGGGPITEPAGTATRTSTARAVGRGKRSGSSAAAATATARVLTVGKARAVLPAPAGGTAQPITPAKTLAVGTAVSTATARPVGTSTAVTVPVGTAVTGSQARTVPRTKFRPLDPAATSATARPLAAAKARPVPVAGAIGAARTPGRAKARAVGTPERTATAQVVSVPGTSTVPTAPATTIRTARPVGQAKTLRVGTASTVATGRPVRAVRLLPVGTAAAAVTARGVAHAKMAQINTALVTVTACPFGGTNGGGPHGLAGTLAPIDRLHGELRPAVLTGTLRR